MTAASTTGARILKLGIGLFLLVAGLGGTVLLFIPWRRAMETRSWTETPCTITASSIDTQQWSEFAQPVYRVHLAYRYSFSGREFTGTRWRKISFFTEEDRLVARKTPHRDEAEKLAAQYPPGRQTICWVNPAQPEEAVLEHQSKAAIYTLWWPLLFAVGGAGMIWSAARRKPAARTTEPAGT